MSPNRPWQGLNSRERWELWRKANGAAMRFAALIEAALKEKNK